ncbi:hypothetical protein UVI_02009790 [Ustilaginoidea virens]|nr:hypothetical protein UVI_02009790 [Ustilaginoidea virens]
MRRTNLILLAATQMSAAKSLGFSIHDDMLAFPQFEVVFDKTHVSERDAQALVERGRQDATYAADFSDSTNGNGHATTTASTPAAASAPRSADSDEIVGFSYEILKMSPHRYLCTIPTIRPPGPVNATDNALAKAEEERERHRATVKGWELLHGLQDFCLYYVSGWWSYSFCKNREIVQYHAVAATGKSQVPKRDPNGQEYILGRVPTLPATTGDEKSRKQRDANEPARLPAELQIKGDQRYLVQRLGGGTVCDLTGKERTIEVQYQCVPGLKHDKIGWVKEVITCSYVMMINTPRLCSDVAFQPPAGNPANPITCQLISDISEASQPLLDQQTSAIKAAEEPKDGIGTDDGHQLTSKKHETPQITIGGVLVGGKRALSSGDEDGKPVKLDQLGNLFVPKPKILELIAEAASKAEGGKVKELTAEELKGLNVDPKTVKEMREKLKKLAGDSGWKMQLFQMHEEDEQELLGFIDEPGTAHGKIKSTKSKEKNQEGNGGRNAKDDKDPSKGRKDGASEEKKRDGEGSQERFFERDEL